MKWQGYFNSRMGWKLVKEDFPDSFNRNDVISAFEGISIAPTDPTSLIFSPSIIITLFFIGIDPKPSIKVPPIKALILSFE